MKQPGFILRNEKGSTLIVALMILVLLTLIGIAATNTSTTEIQIAGNEKAHKQAFYNADAGVSSVVAEPKLSGHSIGDEIERKDLDNDGADDVRVIFTNKYFTDPTNRWITIQSDSVGGQGRASIIAGVLLPSIPGSPHDPDGEY